jgi:hypothetical protein
MPAAAADFVTDRACIEIPAALSSVLSGQCWDGSAQQTMFVEGLVCMQRVVSS